MRPEIVRSIVDLPAPFEPMTATASPDRTSSETPWSTRMLPYPAWRSTSSSIPGLADVGGHHLRVGADGLRDRPPR